MEETKENYQVSDDIFFASFDDGTINAHSSLKKTQSKDKRHSSTDTYTLRQVADTLKQSVAPDETDIVSRVSTGRTEEPTVSFALPRLDEFRNISKKTTIPQLANNPLPELPGKTTCILQSTVCLIKYRLGSPSSIVTSTS